MDIKKTLLISGLAACMTACVSESPFESSREGTLHMNVTLGSKLTRAIAEDEQLHLEQSCVVYISGQSGLMHKWKGLQNVPQSIPMKHGDYVAEAWAGDSVPASFTQRFFKATPLKFTVTDGESNVSLRCNIANVVVSVDDSRLPQGMIGEYKVTVANSRKKALEFSGENLYNKGYFMMPWDMASNRAESSLTYTIEGVSGDGKDFSITRELENVAAAHEYKLMLEANPSGFEGGGAFIKITVDESELLVDDNLDILGKPVVLGDGFDISQQVVAISPNVFNNVDVQVVAFGGMEGLEIVLDPKVRDRFSSIAPDGVVNFITGGSSVVEAMSQYIKYTAGKPTSSNRVWDRITFTADFLNSLPVSDDPYEFIITAEDNSGVASKTEGKKGTAVFSVANSKNAVAVPAPVVPEVDESDPTSVKATSATLSVEIADGATNPRIEYREEGTSDWNSVIPTRATYTAVINGLKPGTKYEFRGVGTIEGKDVVSSIASFTTESKFSIVNSSFEEWSSYSASTLLGTKTVVLPGKEGDKTQSAWGSGNEGAATANKLLTDKSSDMVHTGSYAARLETKAAAGVTAAGNIFYGMYKETDGTDGVLTLGREYNGSHPSALKFWANYRPGSGVKVKSGNESLVGDLKAGGTDIGQVYVALTTEKVEIRTKASNRKLFDRNDPAVVAYGQVTWKEAFGPDGQLQMAEIPFEYNANAKTAKPRYLIIVASASKYGDFYSGAEGSVMYLDDFELVY